MIMIYWNHFSNAAKKRSPELQVEYQFVPVGGDKGRIQTLIDDPPIIAQIDTVIKGINSNGTELFIIKSQANRRDEVCKMDSNLVLEIVTDEQRDRVLIVDATVFRCINAINNLIYYLSANGLGNQTCQLRTFDKSTGSVLPAVIWQFTNMYRCFTVMQNRFFVFYQPDRSWTDLIAVTDMDNVNEDPLIVRTTIHMPCDMCEVPSEWAVVLVVNSSGIHKLRVVDQVVLWRNDTVQSLRRVTCDKKGRIFAVCGGETKHVTIFVFDVKTGELPIAF